MSVVTKKHISRGMHRLVATVTLQCCISKSCRCCRPLAMPKAMLCPLPTIRQITWCSDASAGSLACAGCQPSSTSGDVVSRRKKPWNQCHDINCKCQICKHTAYMAGSHSSTVCGSNERAERFTHQLSHYSCSKSIHVTSTD